MDPTKWYLVSGQCCPIQYLFGTDYMCTPSPKFELSGILTTTVVPDHSGAPAETVVTTTDPKMTIQPAVPAATSFVAVMAISANPSSAEGSLAPKYIGAIVAGVVGFILVISLAVWSTKRHLNKVMRAVDQNREHLGGNDNQEEQPAADKTGGSADGTEVVPGLHEVHDQPPIELLEAPRHGSMSPDHRWELRGSYDAHGISELDANANRTEGDESRTQPDET
ncbi:uncharacterized protein PG986_000139 [Apiospora aurea]|uniref:Transmembrane protein n=1 Tax=Apiospora aurea TaxID=335848 RepID=A0ABR1QT78_9PEZI